MMMGNDTDKRSSKHVKRSRSKEPHRKSRKRYRHEDDEEDFGKKRRKSDKPKVDDDADDDSMWVEKNIDMDGDRPLANTISTAEKLTSQAAELPLDPTLPPRNVTESSLKRDDWMLEPVSGPPVHVNPSALQIPVEESLTENYGEAAEHSRTVAADDFFSNLGKESKKKPKPTPNEPKVSSREINPDLTSKHASWTTPTSSTKVNTPGGPGSQWRMMRLRRVYEAAEEEGKPIEHVAIDRFGSLEAWEEAKEERRILDEREGRKAERGRERESRNQGKDGERGFIFTDIGSGASSRSSSFRRPSNIGDTTPSTPSPPQASSRRIESLRHLSQAPSPLAQSHTPVQSRTPIPSVMTPSISKRRSLSPSSLNKLQAKVLRAKLMGAPDADKLEKEYDEAVANGSGVVIEAGVRTKVQVLPTLDGQGRLYDVGHGKDDGQPGPGNWKRKKEKFETHDPKTGNILRYNADDDTTTLGEMLRQEKIGGGMADQKNLDAQFANAIMGDGKFQNDLDYIDENAERLGRQKMRSDAMKRQFAIHDYARTQKALASCFFCFAEDDTPPKAPVIAMGTRTYLSCTLNEELVGGHCLIVPIQHHLNMLEGDDDVWDEVRNFMKCLMHMFADEDKGVVFFETVISLKWQKHTCIECVPLPWALYEDISQYFKESILQSEMEWSQHKKLIDFSVRPGGFRRAMVPNLPYFMVQFDHKGERGYGHVIEGTGETSHGEGEGVDEGEKGGGDFPKYFAAEIIGNVLEVEPRLWRRPRRLDLRSNKERVAGFKRKYDKYDWTGMIAKDE